MFDIGFSELVMIAVVALLVIGPQRLPHVARTVGHLFGRMQRYVNDVKADISREMELEELKNIQSSMEETARTMRDSVHQGLSEAESELNELARSADPGIEESPDAPQSESVAGSPQRELPLGQDASSEPVSRA